MPSYRAFRQIKIRHFYYAIWRLFCQILFPLNFPAIRYEYSELIDLLYVRLPTDLIA